MFLALVSVECLLRLAVSIVTCDVTGVSPKGAH